MLQALWHMARDDRAWRRLPPGSPPHQTVWSRLMGWQRRTVLDPGPSAAHAATTPTRRSKTGSACSWSTRRATRSACRWSRPTSRIVMHSQPSLPISTRIQPCSWYGWTGPLPGPASFLQA
jgi:hypothetical protein